MCSHANAVSRNLLQDIEAGVRILASQMRHSDCRWGQTSLPVKSMHLETRPLNRCASSDAAARSEAGGALVNLWERLLCTSGSSTSPNLSGLTRKLTPSQIVVVLLPEVVLHRAGGNGRQLTEEFGHLYQPCPCRHWLPAEAERSAHGHSCRRR